MEALSKNLSNLFKKQGKFVVMVRHGESMCNLAGTLAGWTDSRISDHGKKQANLLYSSLHEFYPQFKRIYCSDLQRAVITAQYATLFSWPVVQDERLREIYFGEHEGEHFDSMTQEMKGLINHPEYHAPKGESWPMVMSRAKSFFADSCSADGVYLCFSHGGLVCALTYYIGLKEALSNCSAVALRLDESEPKEIDFVWKFPEITTQ